MATSLLLGPKVQGFIISVDGCEHDMIGKYDSTWTSLFSASIKLHHIHVPGISYLNGLESNSRICMGLCQRKTMMPSLISLGLQDGQGGAVFRELGWGEGKVEGSLEMWEAHVL